MDVAQPHPVCPLDVVEPPKIKDDGFHEEGVKFTLMQRISDVRFLA